MIVISEKKIENALIIGVLMLTIFYNIGAGLCLFFNVNPSIFNFSYKIIGTLFTLYALIGSLILNKHRSFPRSLAVVIIFWIIYSARLLYDIQIAQVPFGFSKLEVYSFAFGGALNLTLAIIFCGKIINIERLIKAFKYVIIAANIIIILLLILKSAQLDLVTLFLRRSYFSTESEDIAIINPITIATNGALLSIISIVDIWFKDNSNKTPNKAISSLLILVGILNLLLGGSRGPFIFFGIILLILFIIKLYRTGFSTVFLLKILMIFFMIAGLFLYFFGDLLTADSFAIFNRLSNIAESSDPSNASRFAQINSAWQQFLESPIIGDRFVERFTNFYPHNILLEALMATGIIGTTFFVYFLVISIFKSFKLTRFSNSNSLLKLGVINLFFLLTCLTSGCLWNSLELWAFSILVIVQSSKYTGKIII